MAMLHQSGRPLLQTEIASNLDVSVDCVACALEDLQSRGLITRQWRAGEYTYEVSETRGGTDSS